MRRFLPLRLCVLSFFLLGKCSFERGDRYWSGKPQPIGIDFSASHVTAVYANGTGNFTTLATLGDLPGNEYSQYMYAKFGLIKDWGNDDLLIEDLYDDPVESPLQQFWKFGSEWKSIFGRWACKILQPLMDERKMYHEICFPDCTYRPQRPKSRYAHLLSQSRMNRLRGITPKWFRSPKSTQMTKAKLILDILEYLEKLKSISLRECGVKVTSAIISYPPWAHDFGDPFDEACLLANIEVLEQPHDRVSISTKTVTTDVGPVLVLDHGQYYLNAHRSTWNERNEEYAQRGSIQLDQLGTLWILRELANRVIWGYNLNVTEEEKGWVSGVKIHDVMTEVMNARLQVKFRRDWYEGLEFENRTVLVNLTDVTGLVRVLNMTGEDVVEIEKRYVEQIKTGIEQSIWKHMEIHEYMRALPNYDELKELPFSKYHAIQANIVENVTAPEHIGSWMEEIATIIILDTGTEAALLHEAAQLALERSLVPKEEDQGTCVSTVEMAARGAAMRAMQWVGYWDSYERERLYWTRWDEDDPNTWGDEDGEFGEQEEDEDHGREEDEL